MHPEQLAREVLHILERSPALPGLPIEAELIANPSAGGFRRPRVSARREAELRALHARAEALPLRPEGAALRLHLTDRAGHATEIARTIFAEAATRASSGAAKPALRLLMTAGGDGTSLESLEALMELSEEDRGRWLVIRLPLGTGNDGSEGRDLTACLSRLLGPARPAWRRAVRCVPNPAGGHAPAWSFNIASVGLDAYVTHMTNRLKTAFPGDSYKLWLDIASVLYDRVYKVEPLEVRIFGEGGKELPGFTRPCLLLAFGASGNRQYGSNKRILPGPENVCAISQMPLFRKIAVKGPLAAGRHRDFSEALLFPAERVVLGYKEKILMQRDGEPLELGPADFPFAFELSPPAYQILEQA